MADLPSAAFRETARLLGVSGEVPPALTGRISEIYAALKAAEVPRSVWRIFSIKTDSASVMFDETFPINGTGLATLLHGCDKAALMAATLGMPVDRLINRLQATAMDDAVIMDACASVEIEAFCDRIEGGIAAALGEEFFFTMRFSPGYGDVSILESEKIIAALGAQKAIGLSTTKSGMLFPIKSITAIVGITNQKQNRSRSCSLCGMNETCQYKKRGDTCGL